jgi:hypothetical protein
LVLFLLFVGRFGGGLWLKKRWAYFLFHAFGVPALLLCLVYPGNAFSEDIRAGWAGWLCALVGCTFTVLLNARRRALLGLFGGTWKIVLLLVLNGTVMARPAAHKLRRLLLQDSGSRDSILQCKSRLRVIYLVQLLLFFTIFVLSILRPEHL